jgi:hypothetical protein
MATQIVLVAETAEEYRDAQTRASEFDLETRVDDELQPLLVDGVTPLVVAGAVVGLVKIVSDFIDKSRGGTIIDRTVEPVRISRDRGVPWGHVVILASDGSTEVQVHDAPKDAMERWLTKLLELPKDATKAVVDGIKELLTSQDDEPGDAAAAAGVAG